MMKSVADRFVDAEAMYPTSLRSGGRSTASLAVRSPDAVAELVISSPDRPDRSTPYGDDSRTSASCCRSRSIGPEGVYGLQ